MVYRCLSWCEPRHGFSVYIHMYVCIRMYVDKDYLVASFFNNAQWDLSTADNIGTSRQCPL